MNDDTLSFDFGTGVPAEAVMAPVAVVLIVAVFAALVAARRSASAPAVSNFEPAVTGAQPRLLQRLWVRRGLSLLSVGMLAAAAGMLGYPFYTNLYQSRLQGQLDGELATPRLEQAYRERRVVSGDPLTRIKLPSIGVDVVVVEGVTASALRAGAGHFPATPLPCEEGNVGIAGHRTTYGRPFHNLDRLRVGDVITLETPIGSCTYRVAEAPFVVVPTDLSVVAPTPRGTLTLVTCEPKGSAAKRLIIRADLVAAGA